MSISKYNALPSRDNYYTIGEISRLYHLGIDTIRYYEEKGLLEPLRGENGYRYYSDKTIWRMNVITNLRSLGFPVERIREYFSVRTADSTRALLGEELALIDAKMREMRALQRAIRSQLESITAAESLEADKIAVISCPERRAFRIMQPYSRDEDMDLLMKRLLERSGEKNYMIGNTRLASVISEAGGDSIYDGALILDRRGDFRLPAGEYLRVCYRGRSDSVRRAQQLRDYAQDRGLCLAPPFLDIVLVDIHTSADPREHISEVQALIERQP